MISAKSNQWEASLGLPEDIQAKAMGKSGSQTGLESGTINLIQQGALGLIETEGFIAAIAGADAALKAANVTLLALGKVGSGIVTIMVVGDIGAVAAGVSAGSQEAAKVGILRTSHVIPRLSQEVAIKLMHPIKPIVVKEANLEGNFKENASDHNGTEVLTLEKMQGDFGNKIIALPDNSVENNKKLEQPKKEKGNDLNMKLEITNVDSMPTKLPDEDLHHNSYAKSGFEEVDVLGEGAKREVELKQGIETTAAAENVLGLINQENEVELLEKSNMELRKMIAAIDGSISGSRLKAMRKEDLINYLNQLKNGKK